MGPRRSRILSVLTVIAAVLAASPAADAHGVPSLRLRAATSHVTVERSDGDPIFVDPGVRVASTHGAFELRVKRRTYDDPLRVVQVERDTHRQLRQLPSSILDGWHGLANFVDVTVTDGSNTTFLDEPLTFCPDSYYASRVSRIAASNSRYPEFCDSGPFTKGAVWGIERGWAVDAFGNFGGAQFDGPDGHYTLTISIEPLYRQLLKIPDGDATATVGIDVTTTSSTIRAASPASVAHHASVPTVRSPDRSTLPELISAPAWDFLTTTDSGTGHDLLTFGATEWNAGPAPLVVEGFRRPGTDVMDAYQYFFKRGRPVSRARVGTFEFDFDVGHEHWHFQQFAEYSLLDADQHLIVPSEKDGFCLAPTDAIDLTRRGAVWKPETIGFRSACGDLTSTFLAEVLPAGWGDTYYQFLPGQSFDITGLPNGTYFVKIQVNPLGKLFERRKGNDTSLREIELSGVAGARKVVAPPWHGIDTECGCF